MTENLEKIAVFYDGKCGLCAREINHYKKIAPINTFKWVDITKTPELFTSKGYKISDGLRALHVLDENNKMHVGIDGFIIIWKKLKNWKYLACIINLPVIRQCANFAYKHFANWRFKKLGYCKID